MLINVVSYRYAVFNGLVMLRVGSRPLGSLYVIPSENGVVVTVWIGNRQEWAFSTGGCQYLLAFLVLCYWSLADFQ